MFWGRGLRHPLLLVELIIFIAKGYQRKEWTDPLLFAKQEEAAVFADLYLLLELFNKPFIYQMTMMAFLACTLLRP